MPVRSLPSGLSFFSFVAIVMIRFRIEALRVEIERKFTDRSPSGIRVVVVIMLFGCQWNFDCGRVLESDLSAHGPYNQGNVRFQKCSLFLSSTVRMISTTFLPKLRSYADVRRNGGR